MPFGIFYLLMLLDKVTLKALNNSVVFLVIERNENLHSFVIRITNAERKRPI